MKTRLLALTLALAMPAFAEAAAPPADVQAVLRDLSREYHWLGLPAPPKGARLVKGLVRLRTARTARKGLLGGSDDWEEANPGFLFRRPGAGLVVQCGFTVRALRDCEAHLRATEEVGGHQIDEVVVAVQCHLAGRDDIAVTLLASAHSPPGPFGRSLEAGLRLAALKHWRKWACEKDSDWGLVHRRLRVLLATEPALKGELGPYLQSMQATLSGPGRPAREGDELVERLIRFPSRPRLEAGEGGFGNLGVPLWGHDPHNVCRPFQEGGFKAIAALVRGLDDRRLTRRRPLSWHNECTLMRVDEACSEFLVDIIGRDTVERWGPPGGGKVLPREKVLAWWAKARRLTEEDYYFQSALSLYPSHNSEHHLDFIALKNPKTLPALYRKLLRDHPGRDGADVLERLLSSKLAGRAKREAVLLGATKGSPVQRRAALAELRAINPTAFVRLLTKEMEGMPRRWKDAKGRHELVSLIDYLEDEGLWKAYLKAVRRAEPELRMRLLGRFRPESDGVWAERRLSLYAPYMNDYTVMPKDAPDNPARGQMALMCGDLLAYRLRDALKVQPPVRFGKSLYFDPSREKWDAFRAKAIDVLQRRLAEMERER
jgi:hypothetical protein